MTSPSGEGLLRVFLCHSSADKTAVREVNRFLSSVQGIDPWLDEERLLPGQDWEHEIRKAVKRAHIVIVCLSQSSTTKTGFVQKEIRLALDAAEEQPEGAIFIIPLKLDQSDVPQRLRAILGSIQRPPKMDRQRDFRSDWSWAWSRS